MPEHKDKLRYKFETEPGEWTKKDLTPDHGMCDAFMFVSILYPADGSLSTQFSSVDGRNNGKMLEPKELFKMWIMLASNLAQLEGLDNARREFARMTFEAFCQMVSTGPPPRAPVGSEH